jgi:hypothetical protein
MRRTSPTTPSSSTRHHPNADLQLSLRLVPRRRFDPNAGEERRALRKSVGSVA